MQGEGGRDATNAPPATLRSQRHFNFTPAFALWGARSQGSNVSAAVQQAVVEEADKDDVSDDEAQEERHAACAMKVGRFFQAIFPDFYPFLWLLLPFVICGLMFLLHYGKIPPGTEYNLGRELGTPQSGDFGLFTQPATETGTISAVQLQKEEYLILVYWSLCAAAIWLLFMLFRVMVMMMAMNLLPYETQVLTAFIAPVDPEIVYVAWSVVVFVLWKATFYERDHFILPEEGLTSQTALYRSRLFGRLSIKKELLQEFTKLWIAIIILTVRHLLLSVLTFLFEIGFMKSMNTQLVVYLSKYSIIRRLNTKWSSSVDGKKRTMDIEKLSAVLNDASTASTQQELSQSRAGKLIVFRFRNILTNKGHRKEYFGSGMPQQLTTAFIKRTVTSGVHNWILIQYVLQFPPAFFLYGRRIELLSKTSTTVVAEQFFAALMAAQEHHFPPKCDEVQSNSEKQDRCNDVPSNSEEQDPEPAATPVQNQPGDAPKILPKLSMRLQVQTPQASRHPSARESLQGDEHLEINIDEPGSTHQQMFADSESDVSQAEPAPLSISSPKRLTSLSSFASYSMEALFSHEKMRQSPAERVEHLLRSRSLEEPPRSSDTSSMACHSLDDQEEVTPIRLQEDPRPEAQATSSLFASSLPNPPWLHELYNSETTRKTPLYARMMEGAPAHGSGSIPTEPRVQEAVFGKELVGVYLKPDEDTEFMHHVDLGGYGKINQKMLKRAFFSIYKLRKAFIKAVTNQVSICNTVEKMISLLLWVVTIVGLLLLIGLNFNTVLISGAATLSALTVALSNLYKEFIGAVIFIAISNPYNVGDRIRIDFGDPLYVKRIRTYTTQFEDVYGKQVLHSNDALWKCIITNESRAKNASHNFIIRVQIETQILHLRLLEISIKQAMDSQPMDYVKDSFLIFINNFEPGKWLEVSIWVTTVENWGNITKTLRLRTDMFLVIQSICYELGITYHEARLPVEFEHGALRDVMHSSEDGTRHGSAGESGRSSLVTAGSIGGIRRRFNSRPDQH
ncbi:hypothetical protein Efla_005638 [Eimeria flavescens]